MSYFHKKGYKGFNKGLICRGKQYAEHTTFEEDKAAICQSGMHFCENPLAVFEYYPPADKDGNLNEYAEVEADEACTDDGIKFCTKKLHIGAKVNIADLVQAFVNFTLSKDNKKESNTGDYSAATNTGDYSAASVEGIESVAVNTGVEGKAKGSLGCYIALAEWKKDDEGLWHLVAFKSHKVDGRTIKPDTFYTLINGKFKEVK